MKKILLIKIGAIGDVVCSMPMLSQIKKEYPDSHITWVVGKASSPLLRATNLVDEIIEISERHLLSGNILEKFACLVTAWLALFGKSFDLILTAHVDPRYRLFSLFSKGKKRRMFNRYFSRKLPVPGRYHVHEYLRLLDAKNNFTYAWPKLHLSISKERQALFDTLPESYITLFPGGRGEMDKSLRCWPLDHYVSLAETLVKRGYAVLLIGGKEDAKLKEAFRDIEAIDLIGETDLLETLYLLKNSSLFITHDGGPYHLAKMVNCPTIGLFGPTNPREFTDYLNNPQEKVLWGGNKLSCTPCYDGKTFAPCLRAKCMQQIEVKHIIKLVECAEALRIPSEDGKDINTSFPELDDHTQTALHSH